MAPLNPVKTAKQLGSNLPLPILPGLAKVKGKNHFDDEKTDI